MKKFLSALFACLMVCTLFSGVVHANAARAASKISDNLSDIYSDIGGGESTLVYVEMRDVSEDAVMEEFARRYPEEYTIYVAAKMDSLAAELTSEDEVLLDQAVMHKRQIYKEFYSESNNQIIDRYFSEEDQLFVSGYAPVAIVEASQANTWAMARSVDIVAIHEFVEDELYVDSAVSEVSEEDDVITDEFIEHLMLANQISRADILRDTYGLTGHGVKIGTIEVGGIPDTSSYYLQSANITIHPECSTISTHSTRVVSIMAASDADGYYGIVPDAEYYCCNISRQAELFFERVEWLLDCGVNIINASMGFYGEYEGSYNPKSQWVDHIAVLHDVHFVATAGNDSAIFPENNVSSPGTAYNAITVGGFVAQTDAVESFELSYSSCFVEKNQYYGEKPNLIAKENFYVDQGTSFAAPQVTGVIAQLCQYNTVLKYKQSAMGAILSASAAEKVDGLEDGKKGDEFYYPILGSTQISEIEGAGILDALWAWGIVANYNYASLQLSAFPYSQTFTVDTSMNTLTRIAIFWLKRNVNVSHNSGEVQNNNAPIMDLNLFVYDSYGDLVCSSTLEKGNFEIVQFIPEDPAVYTIVITGSTDNLEHVGLAIW